MSNVISRKPPTREALTYRILMFAQPDTIWHTRTHRACAHARMHTCTSVGLETLRAGRTHTWACTSQLARLGDHVNTLADAAGACSRITNTPVPLSYSRHTSRFLTIWLGSLSFVLTSTIGTPLTLPVVVLICWMLLGIEELGHLIEQPFKVHPYLKERSFENCESYDVGVPTRNLANNIVLGIEAILKDS